MLVPGRPANRVVLLKGQPDMNECLMINLDGFEGIGAEKAEEVKAVCGEGVLEFKGGLPTGEPADDSAVYFKASEHLADLWEFTGVKVW